MRRFLKYFASVAGMAFIFANAVVAQKQQSDEKAPKFNVPIPVGQKASGVKIPDSDENGKLKTFFNIDELLRVDVNHLKMTNAKIETYDDEGRADMTVLLPVSVLDLNTRVLTSDRPFMLRRTDFDLVGDSLELNTVTHQGRVTGKVKMIIFNFGESNKEQPAP